MPGAEVGHGLVSALGLDFPATTPFFWPKIRKFGQLQGFDGFLKQKPVVSTARFRISESRWFLAGAQWQKRLRLGVWGCPSEGFLWEYPKFTGGIISSELEWEYVINDIKKPKKHSNAGKQDGITMECIESYPIGSMYAIYGNIYHQYTPNVCICIYI